MPLCAPLVSTFSISGVCLNISIWLAKTPKEGAFPLRPIFLSLTDKSNEEFGEPKDVRACIVGTKGWEIIEILKPQKGEVVIQKDKYDAFYGTNLENIVRQHGIDTLIFTGVLTNNCVRATAEGAHYRGFKLFVVSDCCGGTSYLPDKTDEEIHDITLRDLRERMYETKIVTFSELKEIFSDKKGT